MDQSGEPIPGVQVRGSLLLKVSPMASANQEVLRETDARGRFEFVGLRGANFGVLLDKAGYESGACSTRQANVPPSSDDPVVFTLWKRQGAEPMVHSQLDSRVPYDGRVAAFDLRAGKKADAGELRVTLTRRPLQVQRGAERFDWTVKIELPGGGLREVTESYPYWAPDDGYNPAVVVAQTKNDPGWTASWTRTFYVRTSAGHYGRIRIDLAMDSEREDTGFSIETWLNPAGSRNLEFDEANQLRP